MSSLIISAPTISLPNSSNLVGSWDVLLVIVRRSSPTSRLSYWPKIQFFLVSTQLASLLISSRLVNLGGSDPFCYLDMSFGGRCPV